MPQKTNLNISPYYDDFDKDNNFYKVLFKPGHPVQARELTTLQTMLQEQVSSFGSHIFKEGSMVIPGSLNYDPEYYSIKINDDHQGIPVSLYTDKLKGLRLTGQSSGVTVTVDNYALPGSSVDVTDLTLYVKYLKSGSDNTVKTLEDGEELIAEQSFVYGNTAVNSGNTVATLISLGASAIGCAVGITTGVYFIRGTFVDVAQDKIVLDPYTNTPSYRVGLNILEDIVTAKEDDSLYDNARGYSNYAAPGADRLKISTVLSKKPLSDYNDKSFVELIKLDNGEIKKLQDKSQYSIIKDYFAKRTFEESGDYTIGNFGVEVKNSLNDGISNKGIYLDNQVTEELNTPNDDLMCVKVSSGKAYVRGFDVDKAGTTVLDVDKPRDKRSVSNSLTSFEMGSLIKVNNVSGTPVVGLGNNRADVEFYNQRKDATNASPTGATFIGTAKVYAFNVSDAAYTNAGTEWDLYVYDVQTFTGISFNTPISSILCPESTYVRGLKSGATGYVASHSGATTSVKYLSETSGTFLVGEEVIFNEDPSIKRMLTVVTPFGIKDVASVYDNASTATGYSAHFVADVVMEEKSIQGWRDTDKATINSGGVITSASGADFTGLKVGDHVSYSRSGISSASYGEVTAVAANGTSATIVAVANVIGVNDGALPGSTIETSLKVLRSKTISNNNAGLYAPLGSNDVSDLNLSSSNIIVTTHLTGEATDGNGRLAAPIGDAGISSAFFESFDAERYSVHYSDSTIGTVDGGDFALQNGGGDILIDGLEGSKSNIVVSATVRKVGLRSKQKNFLRSEKVTISKTIVGVSTVITGLSTSPFYGTRVQDKEVCLNVPDVSNVIGVYESLNTLNPTLDRLTFISGLGLDTNTVIGEKIVGAESGAVAQLTSRNSATEVEFAYLNSNKFGVGEIATFQESGISSPIVNVLLGNYLNITNGFTLDNGQKEQFYDYSRLVRNNDFLAPNRRITVVYNAFDVPTNDTGDVYTVESYAGGNYGNDIPTLKSGVRASDILDFRPRVSKFTATDKSPFQSAARIAWQTGGPILNPTPNESALLGYEHYLPRTDKLILDIDGNFSVIKGISATEPKEPTNIEGAMDIATIHLPAYLYNPDDALILVRDNRRFTMRDIGKIEDRVDTLETVTSLSLLELDTKTLQVQDATGLSRFKSGFFVDDFKDVNLLDINNPECTVDINGHKREMNVPLNIYSLKPQLALEESIDYKTADFSADLDLLDPNVQKTGDLITLKYEEVAWIEQPLASRVENVNPFNMIDFQGRVELRPESDSWVRDVYVSGGTRRETGDRDHEWIETIKISSHPDTHMRSRNVGFEAGGLKPVTRYYPYFDSTSGIDLVPKLLEITMSSGTFTPGERVSVYGDGHQCANIRICAPNHKGGNINNVSTTFNANPYNTSVSLPSNYSASSDVLNIDIRALTDDAQGEFWGYIPPSTSTVLCGHSSGAEARVKSVRLVTDTYGDVGGAWWFRNPLTSPPPPLRFGTGTKNFKLTSSSGNATPLPGSLLISSAETTYSSNGIVDTYRQTEVIVRRPPPPPDPPGGGGGHRGGGKDPLAQSFTVDETGAFLTSVDLFFGSKDPSEKIVVEVRTVELGTPTDQVVADFARVTLEPSQVNTSATGEVATKVTFPSPIYLQPREEYAIVLLSPSSDNYEAWIARMGERTVNTQSLPDAESVMVTRQYTGGSLFKSQNGTIWSPSQFEDLKFKLYKAKFTENVGTVYFYNPSLETNSSNIQRLQPNAVRTLPRKLRVTMDNIPIASNAGLVATLSPGRKVSEGAIAGSNIRPTGFIEKAGGTVSAVSVTMAGTGYKPGTYNGSSAVNVIGDGIGLKLNITVNAAGQVAVSAISVDGAGYLVGDVVTVNNDNTLGIAGSGAEITITAIDNLDTLYLTDVQGENFTTGEDLVWYDDAGVRVAAASTDIVGSSIWPDNRYSGNVLEINQYNHGMAAANNKVTLANISPNTVPEILTANLSQSDTTISVASTTVFSTYQGITTSAGYVQINDEIIQYNSIGSGTLGIAARGVLGSLTRSHDINNPCYKYELNGIGLTAINTDHDLPAGAAFQFHKDIHKYYLQVTRPANKNSGDDMINFTDEQSLGESDIFASQNFQFNGVQPQFNVLTPGEKTSVSSKIRTVSGTSAGGSELSFVDKGFESVELNQMNDLDSTRMVCSRVNENQHLNTLAKQRSTTLGIQFNSQDTNLSPILDTATGSLILKRDLVNKPISDYVTDDRSNQLTGDPHAAVYISKKVDLKQPATSLKVLVGAYVHSSADFRVLYQLHRQGSSEIDQSYEFFPGYDNLRDTDGDGFGDTIIDISKNSGRADANVGASRDDEFREYQFSDDNLDAFVGFTIKIVASGTDEAYAPRFKDLRVLALA